MKKILIISQNSLSLHANNGKTLTGIFDSWDADDLAQIFFQDEIPESKKFINFYRIRDIDVMKSLIFKRRCLGGVISPKPTIVDHHQEKGKIYKGLIGFAKKFTKLKNVTREFLYKNDRWNSSNLDAWILEFAPDAIFLVPSSYNFTYDIALSIKKKFNIPIYVYYTDDFLGNDITNIPSSYKAKALEVMRLSSGRFVIGEEMARVYKERYKLDFSVLIHPIHIPKTTIPAANIGKKDVISIVYAGGLTLGRFSSLISFSKLINQSEIELNKKVLLKVCTGDIPSQKQVQEFNSHNVDFLGRLSSVEVDDLYKSADFLLHVESDLDEYIKMTRLSVSTKIPECLATGIGLIAYGPSEIASMKLIYENGIGFYIDSRADTSVSNNKLLEVLTGQENYRSTIEKGLEYARINFTSKVITSNLVGLIN
ncbi:glycosyltransferase family 4 protein [Oceanimonas sp. GK1]|uniref:glycosyltransferase family 4 protein n=1 Tax=Oceanimonas sp. (strain GK1 / IBRC-M 10197) TaxID=511062 RepID=UPI0002EDDB6D|nr:glycosyltransferase family 4 protein [Oceanimonas sp. GK1]